MAKLSNKSKLVGIYEAYYLTSTNIFKISFYNKTCECVKTLLWMNYDVLFYTSLN